MQANDGRQTCWSASGHRPEAGHAGQGHCAPGNGRHAITCLRHATPAHAYLTSSPRQLPTAAGLHHIISFAVQHTYTAPSKGHLAPTESHLAPKMSRPAPPRTSSHHLGLGRGVARQHQARAVAQRQARGHVERLEVLRLACASMPALRCGSACHRPLGTEQLQQGRKQ